MARGQELTHSEIARRLGLTRREVMELEKSALGKVRDGLKALGIDQDTLEDHFHDFEPQQTPTVRG